MEQKQPETLKEALDESASLLRDCQILALALERLRRSVTNLLETRGLDVDTVAAAVEKLEDALAESNPGDGLHLGWAADVLDEKLVRRRMTVRPQAETFEEVRSRAREYNLYVHFVRKFEGSEYAIYRGNVKIAEAANERLCMIRLRLLIRAT